VKIDKPSQVNSTSSTRRASGSGAARPGEFAKFLDKAAPSAVSGGSPISSIDALFAAQSVDATDQEGRRQARQRGEELLNKLDDLRHGLLMGTLSRSQLLSLRTLVRSRRNTFTDPKLNELLDEIELRAEVEIAKLSAVDSSLD
jgi:hypothetical protein